MKTFPLKITSPDGDIFNDNITTLSLRGIEGDLAIMADHIPFFTLCKPGNCKIQIDDQQIKTGYIESGILKVSSKDVTLLCGDFKWEE